jgi:hypothetical protein
MLHGTRASAFSRCVACADTLPDSDDGDSGDGGDDTDDANADAMMAILSRAILHPSGCAYTLSSSTISDSDGISDWWWGGEGAVAGSERGVLSFILMAVTVASAVGFVLAATSFKRRRERLQRLAAEFRNYDGGSDGKEEKRGMAWRAGREGVAECIGEDGATTSSFQGYEKQGGEASPLLGGGGGGSDGGGDAELGRAVAGSAVVVQTTQRGSYSERWT